MNKIVEVDDDMGSNFSLISAHFTCEKNPYSEKNPFGYINFGTAQNYLIWELIKDKLKEQSPFLDKEDTHYGALEGAEEFRKMLAKYFSRNTGVSFTPNNIIVTANSLAIFEDVLFFIAKEKKITVVLPLDLKQIQNEIIKKRGHQHNIRFIDIVSLCENDNYQNLIQLCEDKNHYYIINISNSNDLENLFECGLLSNFNKNNILFFIQLQCKNTLNHLSFGVALADEFMIKNLMEHANFCPASTYLQKEFLTALTLRLEDSLEIVAPSTVLKKPAQKFLYNVAKLMTRWAQREISANDLFLTSGATPALESLAFALTEGKDGSILIPAPYYSGFDHAFCDRIKLKIVPLHPKEGKKVSAKEMQVALCADKNIKIILICSPINPTGIVYTKTEIQEFVNLADRFKVHIIFDEMYAHSVFPGVGFFSALSIKSEYVHVVWGLAKDFGLSGFKIGIAYTQNKKLKNILQKQNFLYAPDIPSCVEKIFRDEDWFFETINSNKKLILDAYQILKEFLNKYQIHYEEPEAGIFLWVDLSRYLDSNSYESEMKLSQKMFNQERLSISPGQLFHAERPGWFRICYVTDKLTLVAGLERLDRVLLSSP